MNKVIIFSGPPCSGKSTIAAEYSKRNKIIYLQMDELREYILPNDLSADGRKVAYKAMNFFVLKLVDMKGIREVVLDATFLPFAMRRALEIIGSVNKLSIYLIEFHIDPDKAVNRFMDRKGHPARATTPERVEMLAREFPYYNKGMSIDGSCSLESVLKAIENMKPISLDGSWSESAKKYIEKKEA